MCLNLARKVKLILLLVVVQLLAPDHHNRPFGHQPTLSPAPKYSSPMPILTNNLVPSD